jgi:hypothetical protein
VDWDWKVSRRELDGLDLGRAVGGHVAGAGAIARDREEENEISRVTVSVTQGFVPGDFFWLCWTFEWTKKFN